MKDYEDEAFDELEKSLQRKVAHGVTDGSNGYGGVERLRIGESGITWRGPDGNVTMKLDSSGLNAIRQNWTLVNIPKAVGAWVLYGGAPQTTKFMMYAKPTDEQIKNTEALLGWKWEDV